MTKVFNGKIVFRSLGALMVIESLFMAVPTLYAWLNEEPSFGAWLVSTVLTYLAAHVFLLAGRGAQKKVGEREGYVIVASVWVVFSVFGMLPFWLSGVLPSLTDCWFETMAGFTTTGATVCADVESLPRSVLLWRAMMQWIGGMGIIVLSVAILPMFGLGGMQLYSAEVTGVSYEKLSPRIADTAKHMWVTYILLTAGQTALLFWEGMPSFDALCHSMSTISTGGFSTRNNSMIDYNAAIQWTTAVFMFLSGLNFTQLILLFRGRPSRIFKDEESRWYSIAVIVATLFLATGLFIHYGLEHDWQRVAFDMPTAGMAERALRKGFFMVTSAVTSTGFAASDYMTWPKLLWVFVFFMMFTGASSGSTAGGIKWVRIGIFAKSAMTELKRRVHPNAVIPVRFNGRTVSEQTTSNVMAFMFFYIVIIILASLVCCASGVAFDEAIGTAVSGIGNVGVSIGQFGPLGSYVNYPSVAKWTMTFVMLIGRLEIFTVLLLFSKELWRK
ncbi:MAG: TrkH family potassium uptake protein [Paludibacteraceae bacterium]|nr:TrkH family potassium uptake protein [Paludibacteraceae bacterium]